MARKSKKTKPRGVFGQAKRRMGLKKGTIRKPRTKAERRKAFSGY